ncbi:MAG: radical SAM protein [Syntrophomonadaceae bacterium]|nr:radical SAM protein [Syntrophomonadaceae bacterium]MDD3888594.1 radical SAM protein [Syntrophomonadaceae bacterium]MDD4549153.1 radical SAM protein [Syntrophomonadaceae bacterium]
MYLTLYANEKGELIEHPGMGMLGRSGKEWLEPIAEEMILLPEGSSLVTVPYRIPVGIDENGKLAYFDYNPFSAGEKVYAVAALLPQGFSRTLLPACTSQANAKELPLFGYTAVGFKDGEIYVAAVQSDEHRKWHPERYNTKELPGKIKLMLEKYPENRILRQLAHCSMEYGCFTAQNIFCQRWEGGIPTMNICNANCIGCISESHTGVEAPQDRINFTPETKEIVEIGLEHLNSAPEAIISFGQGCEGEPSLNARKLSEAIKQIRQSSAKGTININTNAGYTEGITMMCDAGMDAMRVTIFSCVEDNYNSYHRPSTYSLSDVKSSIKYAKDKHLTISMNLLIFPGFTDTKEEMESLVDFAQECNIDMIQLRNLNIDPDFLMSHFPNTGSGIGITNFIELLQKEIPRVVIGSYTHPVR